MAEEHATIIPQLLAENEQALLRDWMESQKKSGALGSGQISEAELTEASRRLLAALRGGAATGQFVDITASAWDQSRTVLEDVSRSRALLGLLDRAAELAGERLDPEIADRSRGKRLLLLGALVAKSLPQSRDCKIKEGAQLQRHRALAGVDNADRHR